MAALHGAPALRAVRNILKYLAIQPDTIYNLPVSAFSEVSIGRRLSATSRLVASVLFQANDSRSPTLGQYQWDFTIVIEMFYRVSQDVETAELVLAEAYPAAVDAFYNNRFLVDPDDPTETATVQDAVVTGPTSNPWYDSLASQEYRLQVIFLNCWARSTYDPVQPHN